MLPGSMVAGLLGILMVLVVVPGGAPPTVLDTWVFDLTSDWTRQAPWAIDAAAALGRATDLAGATAVAVLATLVLAARRRWRLAAFVATCGLAGVTMVQLLKTSTGRMRPPGAEDVIGSVLDRSFPSGHASVGVYVYGALAILVVAASRRHGRAGGVWLGGALFCFGITIGLSRIVLGVHWSTDVIAGWALSSFVVLVAGTLITPRGAPPQVEPSDSP